jgi:ethanolamine ammonia-lyase small subunit
VELDGAATVLVEAARVVNADGLSAAVGARVVVAELGVGSGLSNAEEGGNGTDDDSCLHFESEMERIDERKCCRAVVLV